MSDEFLKEWLESERENFEVDSGLKHGTNIDDLPTGKVVHPVKMKEIFPEAFQVEHNKSFEIQNVTWYSYGNKYESNSNQDSAIEYLILNHDRLVEKVERLKQEKQQLITTGYETNKVLRQEVDDLREALHSLIENSDCQTMEAHGYYYTAYIVDEDDINKAKQLLNK